MLKYADNTEYGVMVVKMQAEQASVSILLVVKMMHIDAHLNLNKLYLFSSASGWGDILPLLLLLLTSDAKWFSIIISSRSRKDFARSTIL